MHLPPVASLPWLLPFVPLIRLAWRGRHPALADAPTASGTLVSIVIPARNESANIETVLRSVLGTAYAPLEIIVVDDRSLDDTAAKVERIAREDPRVRLVRGAELPAGWYGKPWACVQGFRLARGELLLFTDADTRHAPALLGHAVGALEREPADLVTILPTQLCLTLAERLVMPQLFFLLSARYHPDRVNHARTAADVIANGQFILVRRDAYTAVGTHETVKHEVAEDLALGQEFWRRGKRIHLAYADQLMQTRMYTSLHQLVEGWSKNLYLGARRAYIDHPLRRRLAPAGVLLGFLFWLIPPLALAAAAAWPALFAPAAWAAAFSLLFWMIVTGGMGIPFAYGLLYPIGALLASWIAARSIVRGAARVEWKGRVYGRR